MQHVEDLRRDFSDDPEWTRRHRQRYEAMEARVVALASQFGVAEAARLLEQDESDVRGVFNRWKAYRDYLSGRSEA
jgi:hypothetical protein